MKIPNSDRRKALILVDIQPVFVSEKMESVRNTQKLLAGMKYDLYVEALFYSEPTSLWARQAQEFYPKDDQFYTLPQVTGYPSGVPVLHVEKMTKSVFKGNIDLHAQLRDAGIEEVHVVGFDTDDCVFATANEAFDLGYATYVIEECTDTSSDDEMKAYAIKIMRNVHLTNHSCIEPVGFLDV